MPPVNEFDVPNVLDIPTVRDLLAGLALQGVLASHSGDVSMPSPAEASRMAREYADSLLAELSATLDKQPA